MAMNRGVLDEEEEILLSQWELINLSDADLDFDAAAISAFVNGLPLDDGIPSACVDNDFGALIENDLLEISRVVVAENQEPNPHDEYEDEEDEDYEDGLDDYLVPRHLSGKFSKQRMMKVEKQKFPKMSKSKRSPLALYVKSRRVS